MVRALKTKFLLFWIGHEQDNCPVAVTDTSLSTAGVSLRPAQTTVPPPTWPVPGLGLAVLAITPTAVFPAASAVERRSPSAPARSPPARPGPDRLRLPPQIRSQPMHPVHQGVAGHPETCGDVGVAVPRSGTLTACGHLGPGPGGGREADHFP